MWALCYLATANEEHLDLLLAIQVELGDCEAGIQECRMERRAEVQRSNLVMYHNYTTK